jgi:hypothetical protein
MTNLTKKPIIRTSPEDAANDCQLADGPALGFYLACTKLRIPSAGIHRSVWKDHYAKSDARFTESWDDRFIADSSQPGRLPSSGREANAHEEAFS